MGKQWFWRGDQLIPIFARGKRNTTRIKRWCCLLRHIWTLDKQRQCVWLWHNEINIRHRTKHKFVSNIYTLRLCLGLRCLRGSYVPNRLIHDVRLCGVNIHWAQHYSLICNAICSITNVVASFYLLWKWLTEKKKLVYGNCNRTDRSTQRMRNKEFELYLTFVVPKSALAVGTCSALHSLFCRFPHTSGWPNG